MAIDDVQFPTDISYGATGGPGFKTVVFEAASGYEQRNIVWSLARGKWEVAHGVKTQTQLDTLVAFFYARGGKAHGFRFKDWLDYQIGDTTEIATRQSIGTTDGSTADYQIYKTYTSGSRTYNRTITRPVQDTTRLWVNDVEISEGSGAGDFSIDLDTGIITLGATLAAQSGTAVEVICEFDIPVRFDIDQMDVSVDFFNQEGLHGSWGSIPVIEIKE